MEDHELVPVRLDTLARLVIAATEGVEADLRFDNDTSAQAWRDAIVTLYVADAELAEGIAQETREWHPELIDWMHEEKLRRQPSTIGPDG
jgi:thymidylate synthase ThyX